MVFDLLISIRHKFLTIQKIVDLFSIEKNCFKSKFESFSINTMLVDMINIKSYKNKEKANEIVLDSDLTNTTE